LCVFLSSFTIFILFAYSPLYIQGALGRTAVDVGMAMLSLSLGWSLGSLILGQLVHALGHRKAALIGGGCLAGGCWMTLLFTPRTTMLECFVVFLVVGLGMGFVTLSTLLVVQESVDTANLGIATAVHQFARTMGGTVGIGVCGSFMTARLEAALAAMAQRAAQEAMPASLMAQLEQHWETLFQPEVQALIPPATRELLQTAVANGVSAVFWVAALAAVACCCACWQLPRPQPH
jgi:predicted MFS family arabinose efflux permease